ncbi:MAG: extracellular solute-binding protein [Clostridia bacterium]|nr:extracellular solute-binding protein [Clostridia bacterium]
MKRVFRLIALALAALCMAGVLTACHGKLVKPGEESSEGGGTLPKFTMPNRTGGSADPAFELTGNYEIVFWAKNDTNVAQKKIYEEAIRDFEALYPNIHVKLKLYTDYNDIYRDVITNIPTETTPNLCVSYPDHIATYLTGANTVVPLDELMEDPYYGLGGEKLKFDGPGMDELVPQFIGEGRIGAHYYALPYMRSTEALYVNKTYVEKLGYTLPETVTWDFVWEVSEAAKAQNPDGTYALNGKNVMIPFIYKSTDNMMIQMLRQLGADYSDSKGNVLVFNDTTRKLLLDISPHAKTKAFSTFKISSYPGDYFNRGECIFAVDSTAGATWIGSESPLKDIPPEDVVEFETVVLPVPQFNVDDPKMISQGPSMCIFNKRDSKEVLATWLLAQFMLTNKVQISYSGTEGYVPVTLKAQNTPEYQDYLRRAGEDNDQYYHVKIDAAKLLLANQPNTFVTPVFNGSAALRQAAGQLIEEVVKSNNRKETVDNAYIDKLFPRIAEMYHLKMPEGGLPSGAVALIVCLGVAWAGLITFWALNTVRSRKKKRK